MRPRVNYPAEFFRKGIVVKGRYAFVVNVKLTIGGFDQESRNEFTLRIHYRTKPIIEILKLKTRLSTRDLIDSSVKIAGVLSRDLTIDDWVNISETEDLQEIKRILESKNPFAADVTTDTKIDTKRNT